MSLFGPPNIEKMKARGNIEGLVNALSDINEVKNREPRPLEMVILKNRRGRAFDVIGLNYWPKQNYFEEV